MTFLPGRRPGDRRVHIARVRPLIVDVAPRRAIRKPIPPALLVMGGFAALIAIGTVLLALPLSAASGTWTDPITALFTATSAVCVTGLVVVDTATHWSPFGQAVIYLLVQVGGFGIAATSTLLLVLAIGRRSGLRDRLLVQEALATPSLGAALPFLRRLAVYTLIVQAAGVAVFLVDRLVHGVDLVSAVTWSVFHGAMAFNTAGFDLSGGSQSLTPYAGQPVVLVTTMTLVVIGGLGYAIVADIGYKRRWRRFALETKLVVLLSAILFIGGAAFFVAVEWDNPATLGALSPVDRIVNGTFLSVTARSSGFNTVTTGALETHTLFVLLALMFIGGASGGTAGGIRVNTLGVLLVAVVSVGRGSPSAQAFGRRIPHAVVYRALAIALLGVGVVFAGTLVLEATSDLDFIAMLFETVSAFGTCGLSMGITPELDDPGRLVVVLAMYAGRLGPLTLVLALTARARPVAFRPAVESPRIG
jgi:trk system potassium uptake protein TrkH